MTPKIQAPQTVVAPELDTLFSDLRRVQAARRVGHVRDVRAGLLRVGGLSECVQVGTMVEIFASGGARLTGEVLGLDAAGASVLASGPLDGVGIGDEVLALGPLQIAPCRAWIGRVIDATGAPIDGKNAAARACAALRSCRAAEPCVAQTARGPA